MGGPNEDLWDELDWTSLSVCRSEELYLLLVYLVMALVPSDTACFDSSPGRMRRTAVCKMRSQKYDGFFDRFDD